MTIFNGQEKNKLIEYFFESIEKYKVSATSSKSANKINMQVGGSSFVINTQRNNTINERKVLSR